MALLRKRFLFLDVNEYWYTYKEGLSNWITLTACCHMKMPFRNSGLMKESRSWTIENDLTLSEEEILAGYSKSLRQQIRQAREGGIIIVFEKEISEFVTFFNDFAERHNLNPTSKRRLEELGEDRLFSYAVYEGQKLSAHSYLLDRPNKIVRSWQSASGRSIEGADKNLVGKANKLLHHEDMKYFKSQGFEVYDFGGYAMDPPTDSLAGINSFKASFGGKVVECKDYYSYPFVFLKWLGGLFGLVGRG